MTDVQGGQIDHNGATSVHNTPVHHAPQFNAPVRNAPMFYAPVKTGIADYGATYHNSAGLGEHPAGRRNYDSSDDQSDNYMRGRWPRYHFLVVWRESNLVSSPGKGHPGKNLAGTPPQRAAEDPSPPLRETSRPPVNPPRAVENPSPSAVETSRPPLIPPVPAPETTTGSPSVVGLQFQDLQNDGNQILSRFFSISITSSFRPRELFRITKGKTSLWVIEQIQVQCVVHQFLDACQ